LGHVPGRRPEAPVRPQAVLLVARVPGLRHGRGRRSLRPPLHRHPLHGRGDRPDLRRRHGRPPVLEGRARHARRDPGTVRLSGNRVPPAVHALTPKQLRGRERRRAAVPLHRQRGRHGGGLEPAHAPQRAAAPGSLALRRRRAPSTYRPATTRASTTS
jgi:hypothetical protein